MAPVKQTTSKTVEAIWKAYEARVDTERGYLGASVIGHPCERRLWYNFRRAFEPKKHVGRMLRLFATGHEQERRLVEDLRSIGATVDGTQDFVSAVGGHFRGHLDGIVTGIPDAPKAVHVLECKTHNLKSFKELILGGVRKAKPEHFAQMQIYMHLKGIDRALYLAVCKDDEQLHAERIELDAAEAVRLIAKAERIILADHPPPKLHRDAEAPEAWHCRFCDHLKPCQAPHESSYAGVATSARVHCRTCLHSTALLDGDGLWHCARHERLTTAAEQEHGCPNHLFIPDLVNGEQVDADERGEWVEYRLLDGKTWRDGVAT